MSATPPDRLAVNPKSPFYHADVLARGIGIRFKGQQRTDVEEYSVTEGWIRVAYGRSRDRHGNPILVKLQGEVEAYFLDATVATPEPGAG
ncbi:MAG: DUF3297 domain-containing protein [Lysobacterales bacterium CG02_land_8_20_14_3_00_62_12]|nr:MAG: DUF3297 domain-containing protein [Xanthomonadales bacterium CG02_land_8_20_14_3_00_62_12]